MVNPTFIGIGGQKCASTWLASCLAQHPDIYVHPKKEIKYFNEQTQDFAPNRNFDQPAQWYLSHFDHAEKHLACGEFTPDYLTSETAPHRIFDMLGAIKILCIVRNPVNRLRSHLRHCIRRGLLKVSQFDRVTKNDLLDVVDKYPGLILNGHYADGLHKYIDLFGRDSVHICVYERIVSDPSNGLAEIYGHLGVKTDFNYSASEKVVGAGYIPRSAILEQFRIHAYHLVSQYLPSALPYLRATRITDLYKMLNGNNSKIEFAPDAIDYINDIYLESNQQLESILGFSLPEWNHRHQYKRSA